MSETPKRRYPSAGWGVCIACKDRATAHRSGTCKECRIARAEKMKKRKD